MKELGDSLACRVCPPRNWAEAKAPRAVPGGSEVPARSPRPRQGPRTSQIPRSKSAGNVHRLQPGLGSLPPPASPGRGLSPSPTLRAAWPRGPESSPAFGAEARGSRREPGSAATASLRERGRSARRPAAVCAVVPWSATSLRKLKLHGHTPSLLQPNLTVAGLSPSSKPHEKPKRKGLLPVA